MLKEGLPGPDVPGDYPVDRLPEPSLLLQGVPIIRPEAFRHDFLLEACELLEWHNKVIPRALKIRQPGLNSANIHVEKHAVDDLCLLVGFSLKAQGATIQTLLNQPGRVAQPRHNQCRAIQDLTRTMIGLPLLVNLADKVEIQRRSPAYRS